MDAVGEDLNPSSGEGVESGFDEVAEGLFVSDFAFAGDLLDFDGGESFDVGVGEDFFDDAAEVHVVLIGEAGVDASDHVDFGDVDIFMPLEAAPDFLDGHFVGVGASFFGVEAAELAEFVADVRVIDMLVADEVGTGPVASFADDVGEVADGGEVGVLVEPDAVFEGEAFLVLDFLINVEEVLSDDSFGGEAHGFSFCCGVFRRRNPVFNFD